MADNPGFQLEIAVDDSISVEDSRNQEVRDEKNKEGNSTEISAENNAAAERGGWTNQLDFLFSCIGYAVGLGNVWRFPYYCFKNGGGAFLVPYFIAVLTCGIPFFVMEITLGQYFGLGNVGVIEKVAPIFKGTGISSQIMIIHINIYYAVVIAWGLFYLVMSFSALPDVPWSTCNNWWNTDNCVVDLGQNSSFLNVSTSNPRSPVEEYWERRALRISSGIEEPVNIQWELLGFLALAWVIAYFIIYKGLHNSGKIIWVTALFPYFVLTILLVRAVTLPGAADGLLFYVTPDFEILKTPTPWIDAGSQVFYSYGLAIGTLFALGSYNRFNNDCIKDAIIVGCINSGTSLYAGVVTFSVLGYMAHEKQVEVKDVVDSGPGLAFLVYPEVVSKLPGAPAWAVLFFLMFCTLGIDTLFCCVEGFITALVDAFPKFAKKRSQLTIVCCIVFFVCEIPMVTYGGVYLLTLEDNYGSAGMTLLLTAFCQTFAFNWVWGDDKIAKCVDEMMGRKLFYLWRLCWKYFGPGFMAFIFVFYFVNYAPVTYGDYNYPTWAQVMGILMALSSMVCIPGYAIYYVFSQDCSPKEAFFRGLRPPQEIRPRGEVKSFALKR